MNYYIIQKMGKCAHNEWADKMTAKRQSGGSSARGGNSAADPKQKKGQAI